MSASKQAWVLVLGVLASCARALPAEPEHTFLRSCGRGRASTVARESFEAAPEFGGQMYVMEAGPEDGPPLVMIHGLGEQGARDFAPLLPALSRRYHILAFDLPGFARSSRRDDVYSPQRYASMVSALVARHFREPVAVLGHSMGGAIALQFAGDHPEQVHRLMVLDVAAVLHYREYLREVIAGSRRSAWQRTLASTCEVLFRVGMFPAYRMRLEDLALEASPTLRAFFSSSRTAALLFVQHDFGPAIRRVRAPTFIGWGAQDTVAPLRTAALLRAQLPAARWRLFADSGHVPMRTEPDAVVDALTGFLDAQLADVPVVSRPARVGRDGVCARARDRVFEGDYDTITIYRCNGVLLQHVRARTLVIDRSEVDLEDVQLDSSQVAATMRRSRVRWTGGTLRADVCLETDSSTLDLAGVRCSYRSESLRVRQPSGFQASASVLSGARDVSLHGEYELFRTTSGELEELRGSGRSTQHSRSARSSDRLRGEWLAGDDMKGASLRGADLREAQLSGASLAGADLRAANLAGARVVGATLIDANLRGAKLAGSDLGGADLRGADLRSTDLDDAKLNDARFDHRTQFPVGFEPVRRGMKVWP